MRYEILSSVKFVLQIEDKKDIIVFVCKCNGIQFKAKHFNAIK